MPEIYVYRGRTYVFRIQGGDGFQHLDTNNPLYITDNHVGGYGMKTDYDKERETIFAGVDIGHTPSGIGPLCEWQPKNGADKADQCATFEVRYCPFEMYKSNVHFLILSSFRSTRTL